MSDLFPVTLDEQIACVSREIQMREMVYANRVRERRMTQNTADRELRNMRAVLETLKTLKGS